MRSAVVGHARRPGRRRASIWLQSRARLKQAVPAGRARIRSLRRSDLTAGESGAVRSVPAPATLEIPGVVAAHQAVHPGERVQRHPLSSVEPVASRSR
jgi:hypothetical protein